MKLPNTQNYQRVLELHMQGLNAAQIGVELGICREWAYALLHKALEWNRPIEQQEWTFGLSGRTAHALTKRYKSKEEFLAERERRLKDNMCKYIQGLGPLGEIEILNWIGVTRHVSDE